MNRSAIITASSIAFAVIAFAGYQTGIATAKFPDNGLSDLPANFALVAIEKGKRIAPAESVGPIAEDMVEWVIDCYDQFGPEGAHPDAISLDGCMPA